MAGHTDPEIRAMHVQLGKRFEETNWRVSATHYRRAGESSMATEVVCGSLETILGLGQYRAADDLLAGEQGDPIVRGILRSRLLLQMGATNEALLESIATVDAAEMR